MKKSFNILLAVALFSFLASPSRSCKAQDAEYQLIRRSYTVNKDGSLDIGFRKEIKLLRNRAITAYADKGETFILYNPATDRLTINESYTIRPDGSRVQTPANAFVDQLPSQCENCGRYNHLRERAVIHTALEYNCIIVLDYTIHRDNALLDETIFLSEDCPIKKYEIIYDINAPSSDGQKYAIGITNMPKSAKYLKQDDKHFHLVVNNLPQNYNDRYLPSAKELYPSVHIAYGDCTAKANSFETVEEAKYLLGELFDNNPATFEKNIRDYVANNIRTNNIPLSLLSYKVSSAKETFLAACGTPADKEHLLNVLLRQAGLETSNTTTKVETANNSISVEEILPWEGNTLGAGYSSMKLPIKEGSLNINPARLTSDRKAPVKVDNCNESYHYTILLPRTPKRMLASKPVDINYSKKGLGSIEIRIFQIPGGGIEVIRKLNLEVANGIVTPKLYKDFRKMMQDWNQHNTITIKASSKD